MRRDCADRPMQIIDEVKKNDSDRTVSAKYSCVCLNKTAARSELTTIGDFSRSSHLTAALAYNRFAQAIGKIIAATNETAESFRESFRE